MAHVVVRTAKKHRACIGIVWNKTVLHSISSVMQTKNARLHPWKWLVLCSLAAGIFAGCEGKDASLQAEMAELREKARLAVEESEQAKARLAKVQLLSPETLKSSLEQSLQKLGPQLVSAFPGYRPDTVKAGRLYYVFGEEEAPYRAQIQFQLKPANTSALTPDIPPVEIEFQALRSGEWQVPAPAVLRELQASATARAASRTSSAVSRPTTDQRPERSTQAPASGDPNTRVISWGDAPSAPAPQAQNPQKSGNNAAPSVPANLPSAEQTFEIRFND